MRARRKKIEKPPMPRRESQLCEILMKRARAEGWIVYPETAGFDILLVATEETRAVVEATRLRRRYTGSDDSIRAGDMVGVEAKMSANVTVLAQAIDRGRARHSATGPDFRIAYVKKVPKGTTDFYDVARELNVGVWTLNDATGTGRYSRPLAPPAFRWMPKRRPKLPPIVPTGPAGVPSPMRLTPWRVKALHFLLLIEARGYVTSEHFRAMKLDPRIWRERWLVPDGKEGRLTKYVVRIPKRADFPSRGFEDELEKLRAMLPQAAPEEGFVERWTKVIAQL
ncbi:MAG TPA: hypothetical protein ENK57_10810 [Polyangiaceae bacterium]|nr:hypothetical protein [Polyangiaceae bacterium]